MKETDLYRIWECGLLPNELHSIDQKKLRIINPGVRNKLSGPDYSDARISFDGKTWAGQVEIHVKSSDWYRHGHQKDPAYQNIILHVVYDQDRVIPELDEQGIPTLQLKGFLSQDPIELPSWVDGQSKIPCANQTSSIPEEVWEDWKESLLHQRLERKSERIKQWWASHGYDWSQVFHMAMARALGFAANSDPMEQLARQVPIRWIRRYGQSKEQVHALFLGTSGWLSRFPNKAARNRLQELFDHDQRKLGIVPMDLKQWKTGGVRPGNQPVRRIIQLANLGHHWAGEPLLGLNEQPHREEWKAFFVGEQRIPKSLVDHLLVNAWLPVLFAYRQLQKGQVPDSILKGFEQAPAEVNATTRKWSEWGVVSLHAGHSQALLELDQNYCSRKKCLFCSSGKFLLHK